MSPQNTKAIVCLGDLKLYRQQNKWEGHSTKQEKRENLPSTPCTPLPDNQKLNSMVEGDKVCTNTYPENQANWKLYHGNS